MPSLDIIRHWILSLAIEGSRNLSDFVPYVEDLHLNVHSVPGAMPHHYGEAFLTLFDTGLIRCFRNENNEHREILADRTLVESVLAARLQLPQVTSRIRRRMPGPVGPASPDLGWELTGAGGEEWELLAQPNWERFVFDLFDPPDEKGLLKPGEAWSVNLDSLMLEIGWCREFNGEQIDLQSLTLEMLQNHPIVYWKILPVVYHAKFLCRSSVLEQPDYLRAGEKWFRDWWISRRTWYREPWTLPNWPHAQNPI